MAPPPPTKAALASHNFNRTAAMDVGTTHDAAAASAQEVKASAPSASKKRKAPAQLSGDAGSVHKIRLVDFMCHHHLEIELDPNINFITGQNGSGKSTILTALCVGLGATAKSTRRGGSIAELIRNGASSATVEVWLNNGGPDAYKPEQFGSHIVIERRIAESGASRWVFKDGTGRKVCDGRASELEAITDLFNIDVSNPVTIMSQDSSREFLHSGSAHAKYRFFTKATLIDSVSDALGAASAQIDTMDSMFDDKVQELAPLKERYKELKQQHKDALVLRELAERLDALQKILAWSYVRKLANDVARDKSKAAKLNDKNLPKERDLIANVEKAIAQAQENLDQKESVINEYSSVMQEHQAKLTSASADHRVAKKDLQQAKTHHLAAKKKATDHKQRIQQMREKANQTRRSAEDSGGAIAQLQSEIAQLSADVEKQRGDVKAANDTNKAAQKESDDAKKNAEQAKTRYQDAQRETNHSRKLLVNAEAEAKGGAKGAGSGTQTLRRWAHAQTGIDPGSVWAAIFHRRTQFHRLPVGPIGGAIALTESRYGKAAEEAMSQFLSSYVVHDQHDAKLLQTCFAQAAGAGSSRAGGQRPEHPSYLVMNFDTPEHRIDASRLPPSEVTTLMSVLTFGEVPSKELAHFKDNAKVVKNLLIDHCQIERTAIARTSQDATRVACGDGSRRPLPNIVAAYAENDGTKSFLRGRTQATIRSQKDWARQVPRLAVAKQDMSKYIEQQIAQLRTSVTSAAEEESFCKNKSSQADGAAHQALQRCKHAADAVKKAQQSLSRAEGRLSNANDSLNSATAQDQGMNECDALLSTVAQMEVELLQYTGQLEEMNNRLQHAEEREKGANDVVQKITLDSQGLFQKNESTQKAISEASAAVEKHQKELSQRREHVEGLEKKSQDFAESIEQLEKALVEDRAKASLVCPESDADKAWDDFSNAIKCGPDETEALAKELQRTQLRVGQEEENLGMTFEELTDAMQHAKMQFDTAKEKFKAVSKMLESLKESSSKRQKRFEEMRTLQRQQVSHRFNGYMGRKGHSGKLDVDYDNKTVDVSVALAHHGGNGKKATATTDTRALSGGERSFATMAFTLALGDSTESPLRAMDEFDVFMDAVNRRISMEALLEFARANARQFIFLTPHDVSNAVGGPGVKVQTLQAARP